MNESQQESKNIQIKDVTSAEEWSYDDMSDDWNMLQSNPDVDPSETLDGFIIARLPDLGESRPLPKRESTFETVSEKFGELFRKFELRSKTFFTKGREFLRPVRAEVSSAKPLSESTAIATESSNMSSIEIEAYRTATARRRFFSNLIVVGVLVFACGMLMLRNKMDKADTTDKEERQNHVAEAIQSQYEKVSQTNGTFDPKSKCCELPGKSESCFASMTPDPNSNIQNDLAQSFALTEHVSEQIVPSGPFDIENSFSTPMTNGNAHSDSPWSRPAADGYSPWQMNVTQRLEENKRNDEVLTGVALSTSNNITSIEQSAPQPRYNSALPNTASASAVPAYANNMMGKTTYNHQHNGYQDVTPAAGRIPITESQQTHQEHFSTYTASNINSQRSTFAPATIPNPYHATVQPGGQTTAPFNDHIRIEPNNRWASDASAIQASNPSSDQAMYPTPQPQQHQYRSQYRSQNPQYYQPSADPQQVAMNPYQSQQQPVQQQQPTLGNYQQTGYHVPATQAPVYANPQTTAPPKSAYGNTAPAYYPPTTPVINENYPGIQPYSGTRIY